MSTSSRFIIGIIAFILILAGIQWWMNTRSSAVAEQSSSASNTTDVSVATTQSGATSTQPVPANPSSVSANSTKNFMHNITIQTNKGTIVFETYDADAPKTVENFVTLANKGFYNGTIFHRVISGFMIQGGDPTGTGMGGPGYKFADELNPNTDSYKAGYVRGMVAMANAGPNTNGSQFFIMHQDTPLPHSYTIFGKVIQGMDVVDAIAATQVDGSDKPLTPVVMSKVTVAENK